MAGDNKRIRGEEDRDWARERREMVDRVAEHFSETAAVTGVSRMGNRLEAALLAVPRHAFVPASQADRAYADSALSIGHGQTISQPFIVALMIELAELRPDARVLEVGTGSGYDAAVLCRVVREVYSVERVRPLADVAINCLCELGCVGVHVRCADGFEGWAEAAPFDAILVTACSSKIPEPLVKQLAVGGRMVIPIGLPNAYQELQVIEKVSEEEIAVRHSLPVAFVPLVHAGDEVPVDRG